MYAVLFSYVKETVLFFSDGNKQTVRHRELISSSSTSTLHGGNRCRLHRGDKKQIPAITVLTLMHFALQDETDKVSNHTKRQIHRA